MQALQVPLCIIKKVLINGYRNQVKEIKGLTDIVANILEKYLTLFKVRPSLIYVVFLPVNDADILKRMSAEE